LQAEKEKKLLKQLQERILQEKMEKHKKKKNNKLSSFMIKEKPVVTLESESDEENGNSFDELSPEINFNKNRKDATILNSVQLMLNERNEEIKENKWKNILEKYNHKKFVSFMPLPQIHQNPHLSRLANSLSIGNQLKRSSTVDNPGKNSDQQTNMQELDLEGFLKLTNSEKNIKVSDTLKMINNIE